MPRNEHEHHPPRVLGPGRISAQLTGGDPRTLRHVDAVVQLVLSEPHHLAELVACVLRSDDEVVRMRAADALEKVCRSNPALVQRHVTVILGAMSRIEQPAVQWHVAEMLARLRLTPRQRALAVQILHTNLERSSDWIVLNDSLATLATLARQDHNLVPQLLRHLRHFEHSKYRSLSNRVRKLLAEFG